MEGLVESVRIWTAGGSLGRSGTLVRSDDLPHNGLANDGLVRSGLRFAEVHNAGLARGIMRVRDVSCFGKCARERAGIYIFGVEEE